MTAVAGAICAAAKDCKAASSCCQGLATTSGGTGISGKTVCWAAGSAVNSLVTYTTATLPTGVTGGTDNKYYMTGAACAAAPAGASALAVSAAAAATAVYMM